MSSLNSSKFEDFDFEDFLKHGMNKASINGIVKVMTVCAEVYQKEPKLFSIKFNRMIREIKLHAKIRETYSSKEEVNNVFDAINFFDYMVGDNQGYNHAYKMASKHHKLPLSYLKSIIGTRNALRRNAIKIQ